MPSYYPAFINVSDRTCVVVGGGSVGEEKVKKLLECGAKVRVISPVITKTLSNLQAEGKIEWWQREYQVNDLADAFIAVSATGVHSVDLDISEECSQRNILLNVVDVTHLCTFIVPSIATRGDVTVATSTGGMSPALARTFREKLQESTILEYADLSNILSWARKVVKEREWDIEPGYWQNCIHEELLRLVQSGQEEEAKVMLMSCLKKGVINH